MTSSRSSKVTALALFLALALAAAVPAAAVSVTNQDVPDSAAVGDTVEASFTIENLYQNPQFNQWTLRGETGMSNVTWIVSLENAGGTTIYTNQFSGSTFQLPDISQQSQYGTVITIKVTVRGEVPPVNKFTYPKREMFLIAELTQQAGQAGSTNTIGSWTVHHYTTGGDETPGSRQARQAIQSANDSIQNATAVGADVSQANSTLENAISSYRNGNFENAVSLANQAENQAEEAKKAKEQGQQTMQLLMYVGLVVLVLLAVGGGYWYYQQQQDTYDKLG